jgi:hypothetical protein
MRRSDSGTRARRALAALVVGAGLGAFTPVARAEEGEPPEESPLGKVREQMEKIARLMRESEEALLRISREGGDRPDSVDVPPPPEPDAEGSEKAPAPAEEGDEIRERLERLIRESSEAGVAIPKELEELLRMWPT